MVEGRSAAALTSWLAGRDTDWRVAVVTAALDPYRGYASALRTQLPGAVRVLDAFHVTRLGFAAVDEVRRRIQRDFTGHRGRRDDPLYRIRRLLRRGADHHCERSWARLLAGLDIGHTHDEQLAKTWIAAQELRLLYRCPDPARAQAHFYADWCTALMPRCPDHQRDQPDVSTTPAGPTSRRRPRPPLNTASRSRLARRRRPQFRQSSSAAAPSNPTQQFCPYSM